MGEIFKFVCIVLLLSTPLPGATEDADPEQVLTLARGLRLAPLEPLAEKNEDLYRLGESLFFEKAISGNRNISCGSCHSPRHYSGDGLALGVGEGAEFGEVIALKGAKILQRHTPHLINVGRPESRLLFWDGRVAISSKAHRFFTPEEGLNGDNPSLRPIVDALTGPLAAQALFPMVNPDEMTGEPGENDLSQLESNPQIWDGILQRLFNDSLPVDYKDLFAKAYPDVDPLDWNIGHAATALAEFQRHFFASFDTGFDRFMRGDLTAMDQDSVNGLQVFMTKARCVTCHSGGHLSNQQFASSGTPQLGPENQWNDEGRKDVTKKGRDRFKFKTPGLRNVGLTAPFMHSGSLTNLEELVDHYNDISNSLQTYQVSDGLKVFYDDLLFFDTDVKRNELRHLQVEGTAFLLGLELSAEDKKALVHFLRFGLTDLTFKQRMENYTSNL